MLPDFNAVIADTSCFILLDKIDALSILQQLFRTVTTTPEIAREFGKPLPEWVVIKAVKDTNLQKVMLLQVDPGEASAIALTVESQPALLIIDDLKGRKVADRLRLTYTGTLGLLLRAKKEQHIHLLRPYLDKIQSTNFRIHPSLITTLLKEAGE